MPETHSLEGSAMGEPVYDFDFIKNSAASANNSPLEKKILIPQPGKAKDCDTTDPTCGRSENEQSTNDSHNEEEYEDSDYSTATPDDKLYTAIISFFNELYNSVNASDIKEKGGQCDNPTVTKDDMYQKKKNEDGDDSGEVIGNVFTGIISIIELFGLFF